MISQSISSRFWRVLPLSKLVSILSDYPQLKVCVDNINKYFIDGVGKIQRIYSTPHLICLVTRIPGQTLPIYLGRGDNYQCIVIGDKVPAPKIRVCDKLLEHLRFLFIDSLLLNIKIDNYDRIIYLSYKKGQKQGILGWFYNGKRLFLASIELNEDKEFILQRSWKNLKKEKIERASLEIEFLQKEFDSIGRKNLDRKEGIASYCKEYELLVSYLDNDLVVVSDESKEQKNNLKFLKNKQKKITADLENVLKYKLLEEFLKTTDPLSLPSMVSKRKLEICGIKISIDNSDSAYKMADKVYQKIKSLKNGERVLLKRLAEVESSLKVKDTDENRNIVSTRIISPVWGEEQKQAPSSTTSNSYEFEVYKFADGFSIGIGKSARGNDELRKLWSKKEDIWVHAEGGHGAHAIIKGDANLKSLTVASSMIIDYSKLPQEEIAVIYTQVKNIKGVRGQAGKVVYNKVKYLTVRYLKWREIISAS